MHVCVCVRVGRGCRLSGIAYITNVYVNATRRLATSVLTPHYYEYDPIGRIDTRRHQLVSRVRSFITSLGLSDESRPKD